LEHNVKKSHLASKTIYHFINLLFPFYHRLIWKDNRMSSSLKWEKAEAI
jgi:hypothetical protein